jgi:hypothetical protein
MQRVEAALGVNERDSNHLLTISPRHPWSLPFDFSTLDHSAFIQILHSSQIEGERPVANQRLRNPNIAPFASVTLRLPPMGSDMVRTTPKLRGFPNHSIAQGTGPVDTHTSRNPSRTDQYPNPTTYSAKHLRRPSAADSARPSRWRMHRRPPSQTQQQTQRMEISDSGLLAYPAVEDLPSGTDPTPYPFPRLNPSVTGRH